MVPQQNIEVVKYNLSKGLPTKCCPTLYKVKRHVWYAKCVPQSTVKWHVWFATPMSCFDVQLLYYVVTPYIKCHDKTQELKSRIVVIYIIILSYFTTTVCWFYVSTLLRLCFDPTLLRHYHQGQYRSWQKAVTDPVTGRRCHEWEPFAGNPKPQS